MPNFDGNGPLKRGRAIGRGRGPCGQGRGADTDTQPAGQAGQETGRKPA